jgi:creatinine amidohydrolase
MTHYRRDVRWTHLFPDELEAAFEEYPLLYLPYGICEPHGPGNALGLDGLIAEGACTAAAQAHGGILAPTWWWHVAEMGGEAIWAHDTIGEVARNWLSAFPPWMFFKSFCYHVRIAERMGFHGVLLVSGHYGPHMDDLARLIGLLQPRVGARLRAVGLFEAAPDPFGDGRPEHHAGRSETSLLWAVAPGCVDLSRLPETKNGPEFAMAPDVHESDRRAGERILARSADWLGEQGTALLAEYERVGPTDRLARFEDMERAWRELVLPQVSSFGTMQAKHDPSQREVEPGSVWFANWQVPPEGSYS